MQDLGSSEIFPSSLRHNSSGRFVVVCGDGEYVVYTALAWRNKSFGSGADFVWAHEPNDFAVRTTKPDGITVYKNFKVCTLPPACTNPDTERGRQCAPGPFAVPSAFACARGTGHANVGSMPVGI